MKGYFLKFWFLQITGGEERRARMPAGRARARGRTAHLRTGGEEECTGTADTNPGCNYLVRGYSPSMHYFWRGDMPHFSPSLPFQRGRAECRRVLARDLGGPDRGRPRVPGCGSPPTPAAGASSTSAGLSGAPAGAGLRWSPDPHSRRAVDLGQPERAPGRAGLRWSLTPADGVPSTSAGQSRAPAHARPRRSPDPCGGRAVDLGWPDTLADGGQPGAARASSVRRGVTAAISNRNYKNEIEYVQDLM